MAKTPIDHHPGLVAGMLERRHARHWLVQPAGTYPLTAGKGILRAAYFGGPDPIRLIGELLVLVGG